MKRREAFISSAAFIGLAAGITALDCSKENGGVAMAKFGDVLISPENEGREKHVPHIETASKVAAGESFEVKVIVGKEVPHPNTIEHHIKWIQLFAKEDGGRPAVHVATFDLGPSYASPTITVPVKLNNTSTLFALEFCNLHGVWENSVKVEVE